MNPSSSSSSSDAIDPSSSTPAHVIVGAGAVGSGTASRLADAGHRVRVITRSGSGPEHANVERVAADASDQARLVALTQGARSLYNCANPPYDQWVTDWPPLAASLLVTAGVTGARLITMSNLYGYAATTEPMRSTDSLAAPTRKGAIRERMWNDAIAAHDAGRVRATELRASDYFGPGLGESAHLGDRVVPNVLSGRNVRVLGDPDAPHSWTYIGDVCAALATLGTDDRSLGRAWHVPTGPARSARQMVDAISAAAGTDPVATRSIPKAVLKIAGVFVPVMREVLEVQYQFEDAFIIDASDTEATFGLRPTPLDEQLKETIAGYR